MKYKTGTLAITAAVSLFALAVIFLNSVRGFTHPTFPPPAGTAGPIPVVNGGTGASTAAGARNNLGAAAAGANSDITSLSPLSGALQVFGQLKLNNLLTLDVSASAPATCNSSNNGSVYFNDTDKNIYDCNAASWNKLGAITPAAGTITYSAPGTTIWTVPDGVYRVTVQVWGGGGGGGGGTHTFNDAGPDGYAGVGGSAGAYTAAVLQVTPGATLSITIGGGGIGNNGTTGTAYPAPSTAGGTSTISWNDGAQQTLIVPGAPASTDQFNPISTPLPSITGSHIQILQEYVGNAGYSQPGGAMGYAGMGAGSASGGGPAPLPVQPYTNTQPAGPSSNGILLTGGTGGHGAYYYYGTPPQGAPGGSPGGGGGGGMMNASCGSCAGYYGGQGGNGGNGKVVIWW